MSRKSQAKEAFSFLFLFFSASQVRNAGTLVDSRNGHSRHSSFASIECLPFYVLRQVFFFWVTNLWLFLCCSTLGLSACFPSSSSICLLVCFTTFSLTLFITEYNFCEEILLIPRPVLRHCYLTMSNWVHVGCLLCLSFWDISASASGWTKGSEVGTKRRSVPRTFPWLPDWLFELLEVIFSFRENAKIL